jgi:hypothetical protein
MESSLTRPDNWEEIVRRKPWSQEENERLKAFVASGTSIVRVAAALERRILSLRKQARKLGTPFPRLSEARKKFADAPSKMKEATD